MSNNTKATDGTYLFRWFSRIRGLSPLWVAIVLELACSRHSVGPR